MSKEFELPFLPSVFGILLAGMLVVAGIINMLDHHCVVDNRPVTQDDKLQSQLRIATDPLTAGALLPTSEESLVARDVVNKAMQTLR